LKTQLEALRHFVLYLKEVDESRFKTIFRSLTPLVNVKDDNDDFFACFLGIKMKTRQKALRMVCQRIHLVNDYKAINALVMPLVNYVIFGDQS
jgi:hypothetical protein